MRIAFDAKRIFSNQTGLGNYGRTLVDNLQQYYPEEDYLLFTPRLTDSARRYAQQFKTITPTTPFKHIWRSYGIKKDLEEAEVDIYHGLSSEIPFWLNNIKTVVTVHDLIFKALPDTYPQLDRWLYEEKTRYACKAAKKIITISEYSKQDIIKYYGIESNRIEVIYPPCLPIFYTDIPLEKANLIAANPSFQQLPSEYILYVGSIIERKNVLTIVQAIWQMPEKQRLPLVIVGKGKAYKKTVKAYIKSHHLEHLIFWIEDLNSLEGLKQLYQQAQLVVFPSIYEGFGLPVAEAMLCGAPVITSNVSSLPEAGGQYAKLVNPKDVEELRVAIQTILNDTDLNQQMRIEGKKDAFKRFNPEKLTGELMELYRSVVGSRQ